MQNAIGSERLTAEQDERGRPDAGPEREDIRGVGDDADDFDEGDEDDLEADEEEGSF